MLIVWALDRMTRDGAEGALRILRQFRERGCTVVSVQESWLNGSPEVQDILVAFAGWAAKQESDRKSARIKAGLARRRDVEGLPVGGRVPGARDKKPRRTTGCAAAWGAAQGTGAVVMSADPHDGLRDIIRDVVARTNLPGFPSPT